MCRVLSFVAASTCAMVAMISGRSFGVNVTTGAAAGAAVVTARDSLFHA